MAIKRTNFTEGCSNNSYDSQKNFKALISWIEENKGSFFTTIEKTKKEDGSEDLEKVVCKVDNKDFITFVPAHHSTSVCIKITTNELTTGFISSSLSTSDFYTYGLVCDNTLSISFGTISNSSVALTICKTKTGKTAVITHWRHKILDNKTTDIYISAVTPESTDCLKTIIKPPRTGNSSPYNDWSQNLSNTTVFCPIPVSGTDNEIVESVLYMPYAQIRQEALLNVNGKQYYTNGLWAIPLATSESEKKST